MTTQLIAFAEGMIIGTVTQAKDGRLTFLYSDEWLASHASYPLSITIPLGHQANKVNGRSNPFSGDYSLTTKLCLANGLAGFTFRPETFSD